jgi:hypothetical protein
VAEGGTTSDSIVVEILIDAVDAEPFDVEDTAVESDGFRDVSRLSEGGEESE